MIVLMIYLTVIVIMGGIAENSRNRQVKRTYLKLTLIFAFLYSGLRGSTVGRDTASVIEIFEKIRENGLSEIPRNTKLEKGYMILNWLLGKISSNPQILLITMSAIICYGFYIIIRDYSENYMISCLIFAASIFTITMNISRQYLALGLFFISIKYALEKKTVRTLFFLAAAGSIHYSAVVFLPLFLISLKNFQFSRRLLAVIGGLSFLAVPFYMTVISAATMIFPQYSRFLASARYSESSQISYAFVIYLFAVLLLGLWSIVPVRIKGHYIVIKHRLLKNGRNYGNNEVINYIFLLMFIEYIVVYFISARIWIAGRFLYYFQASLVIVLPNILDKMRREKAGIVGAFITGLFILYYLSSGYHYILSDPHDVLPYVFFWNS